MQLAIEEKKTGYKKYLKNKTVETLYRIQKTPSNNKEKDKKTKERCLGHIC
jgi:hypothetical protein